MLSPEESKRYSRHLLMSDIGIEGQTKLKESKVLIIGAGGLGCPILQYLTAAGVGKIGIIDFDTVDESNLQRQILYTIDDVGQNKAQVAKTKLNRLNPLIEITALEHKLTAKNALDLFDKYDIIVDGSDNFSTRYLVNDACVITKKTLVYGAIHLFEGQVSVFNYKDGPSYRCLFPDPPAQGSVPNCSEVGVLGVLPGIIGTYQANEVLKIILEIGESLSGKLLMIEALNNSQTTFTVNKSKEQINKALALKEDFQSQNYDVFCGIQHDNPPSTKNDASKSISISDLKKLIKTETLQIIDVREDWETPIVPELKALNIPLNTLEVNLNKISKEIKTVVFCQKGGRSQQAIKRLEKKGFKNLINLRGGISNYQYK